jgi:fumarate reductase subunit C
MSEGSPLPYTAHHPRWYRRKMPVLWWLEKAPYTKFFVREMTSVFVAFFAILYLYEIQAIADGPDAYALFMERLRSPLFVTLNLIALALVLYHTITWFNATPAAMAVRVGGKKVPDAVIIGSQYVAWVAVSGLVAWILLRG